jgi:hypothetical protein
MVGAARKLATELVVIIASATHEIQAVAGTLARLAAAASVLLLSAGTSMALIALLLGRC